MKRAIVAGLAIALTTGTIVLPSAHATFPGRNGRIMMLTQERDGSETFYRSIRPDGRLADRLLFTGERARLSPDADSVVYVETRDLLIAAADGSGARALTSGNSGDEPTWSPDSSQIAFVDHESGERWVGISVIDPLTYTRSKLTDGAFDFHPSWSPDGTSLAFVRCLSYSATPSIRVNRVGEIDSVEGCEDPTELVVLEIATGDVQVITETTATESTPDWSPDSKKLTYTCDASRKGHKGRGGICVVNLGTKRSRVIYRSRRGFDPVWSPNGERIAFVVFPRTEEDTDSEIYTIRPDGTGLRQVTNNTLNDTQPQWLSR